MLIEIREEGYKILRKSVPSQYAEIRKDGRDYGVSIEALPYCLVEEQEDIYLGVRYQLNDNREALSTYQGVMDTLNFKNEDIIVEVRYVVLDMKIVEEVHYKSVLKGRNLPLNKLYSVINDLKALEYEGKGLSNGLVQELIYMCSKLDYEPDRRLYEKRKSFIEYISEESKEENKVEIQEDLFKGTIQKTLKSGEGLYTEELATGELYVKMAHRSPEKIPTEGTAELKKLKSGFSKRAVAVRLLEEYPTVDGYKFYHRDKKVYIAFYEGEKLLGEHMDIVFGILHALLEKYTEKVG